LYLPDFYQQEGSALRRLAVCLGVVAVLVALGAISASAAGIDVLPGRAEAATRFTADWEFAGPAIDDLNSAAIQICSAEATARAAKGTTNEGIRDAQVNVLVGEYLVAEQEYNAHVRSLVALGASRPWDVPSKALPLDLARARVCLKMAVAPPKPVVPKSPALSLVADALAGPVWVPQAGDRFITLEQLDAYAAEAGWPNEPGWWPDMRKIVLCETGSLDLMAHNTSDPHGGSYGLAQLNGSYHFINAGEDFAYRFDPVVNLRTALWLRTVRGHYGGTGGWYNCAKRWGIE
jgi:hypothetical protein